MSISILNFTCIFIQRASLNVTSKIMYNVLTNLYQMTPLYPQNQIITSLFHSLYYLKIEVLLRSIFNKFTNTNSFSVPHLLGLDVNSVAPDLVVAAASP